MSLERVHIIDAADDLFLRYGIKSVSMDDIARKLGVSKKTLYQITDTKSDIVHAVIDEHIHRDEQMIIAMREDSKNAIDAMFKVAQHVMSVLEKYNPSVLYDLQKYYRPVYEKIDSFHRVKISSCIHDNLERGKAECLYHPDISSDIVTGLYVAHMYAITEEEIFKGEHIRRDRLFIEHLKYHFRGICTETGLQEVKNLLSSYPSIKDQLL